MRTFDEAVKEAFIATDAESGMRKFRAQLAFTTDIGDNAFIMAAVRNNASTLMQRIASEGETGTHECQMNGVDGVEIDSLIEVEQLRDILCSGLLTAFIWGLQVGRKMEGLDLDEDMLR